MSGMIFRPVQVWRLQNGVLARMWMCPKDHVRSVAVRHGASSSAMAPDCPDSKLSLAAASVAKSGKPSLQKKTSAEPALRLAQAWRTAAPRPLLAAIIAAFVRLPFWQIRTISEDQTEPLASTGLAGLDAVGQVNLGHWTILFSDSSGATMRAAPVRMPSLSVVPRGGLYKRTLCPAMSIDVSPSRPLIGV